MFVCVVVRFCVFVCFRVLSCGLDCWRSAVFFSWNGGPLLSNVAAGIRKCTAFVGFCVFFGGLVCLSLCMPL